MCGVVVSFVRAWGDREGEGGDSPGGIRRGRKRRGGGGRREKEKKEKERGESSGLREGIFALVIVFFFSLYSTPISLSSFRALRREKARAVGKEKVYSRSSFFFLSSSYVSLSFFFSFSVWTVSSYFAEGGGVVGK